MEYIQLMTKEDFKKVIKQYNKKHKLYMWDFYEEQTCYLPKEDTFISLEKAMILGFNLKK